MREERGNHIQKSLRVNPALPSNLTNKHEFAKSIPDMDGLDDGDVRKGDSEIDLVLIREDRIRESNKGKTQTNEQRGMRGNEGQRGIQE